MRVIVGRIGRPHGIRGELVIGVRTDEPDLRFAVGATLDAHHDLPPGPAEESGGPRGAGRGRLGGKVSPRERGATEVREDGESPPRGAWGDGSLPRGGRGDGSPQEKEQEGPGGLGGEVSPQERGGRGGLGEEVSPQKRGGSGGGRPPRGNSPQLTVASARWHSGQLLVAFAGITDRTAAGELTGSWLSVDSSQLPETPGPDEFRDHELIGLSVRTTGGQEVGVVDDILHYGQDLLVVRRPQDEECLVPFVKAIVPEVDLARGVLVIDPPLGLLDPAQAEE